MPAIIHAELTIAELLERHPELRPVLRSYEIDMCCGGGLALRDAAQARGIPLHALLSALAAALPARPRLVEGADSVRAVLARYPSTAQVFAGHGLAGCGGALGPDERVDLFARIHHVELAGLLGELEEAAARPPEPQAQAAEPEPPAVYRRFVVAAIISTLTLGASFGAYNLLTLHLALGPVPPAHHWVHAGFQVWGFVLLFIMGVASHALPRFFGTELKHVRLVRSSFALALFGLVLVAYGRFGPSLPLTVQAFVVGAAATALSVLAWSIAIAHTCWPTFSRSQLFHRFVAAGMLWWIGAAVLLVCSAVGAVVLRDADQAAAFNDAIYAAALYGGTLAWIQGFFLRTGPVFMGLAASRPAVVKAAFWLAQAGALMGTIGALRVGHPGSSTLLDVGLIATALSVVLFAFGVRVLSSTAERHPGDWSFAVLVRLSFAGSILFAGLAVGYGCAHLAGVAVGRLFLDGVRHAFVLGFVTLLIFAMAGRILPIFGGVALRWPRLRVGGAALIAIGVLLREAQVIVELAANADLLVVSGLSGIVSAVGVCLAGASILGTLLARTVVRLEADVPICADTNVAALVHAHPEAIPILVEAGFAPIASPVLRRTIARAVTLRQAGRLHGVDVDAVLERIRSACTHTKTAPAPARAEPPLVTIRRPAPKPLEELK